MGISFWNKVALANNSLSANLKATNPLKNVIYGSLLSGMSQTINIIGDSTGNSTNEWVYLYAQKLANDFATTHNVEYRLIDPTSKKWQEVIDINSAGEKRHILSTGDDNGYQIPHSSVDYTGSDLDVRVQFSSTALGAADTQTFVSKFGGGGNRCWRMYKGVSGDLAFDVTEDGSTLITYFTTFDVADYASDGGVKFIRVVFDADNGSAQNELTVYTSTDDGVTWSQVYNSTKAGTVSLFQDATRDFEIGSRGNDSNVFDGKFYQVQFMDGIDGHNLFPVLFEDIQQANLSPIGQSIAGFPSIKIYNSSISGFSTSDYDLTLLERAIVVTDNPIIIISLSHNEGKQIGKNLHTAFDGIITNILTLVSNPNIIFLTQNPKGDSETFQLEHEIRRGNICSYAYSNGFDVIDTYSEFERQFDAGVSFYDLIDVDDIHPSNAGSQLWADTVYNYTK